MDFFSAFVTSGQLESFSSIDNNLQLVNPKIYLKNQKSKKSKIILDLNQIKTSKYLPQCQNVPRGRAFSVCHFVYE
ncbi:hypothetical protein DERP_012924 [Dermatophagoides pteronyssinus]|uniref:Uncharacterized protein n=1 Tax=Dermatophagoides pteronyssinus TaxID=6956 RepID=A0ABQ8J3P0_DERPT|nr:hypothetical protein DERP_012924 [Dermatophagoides pteronyssinus]